MRIGIVTGIFPPDIGGPATYLWHLSRDLCLCGHQVQVVTWGDEGSSAELPCAVVRISRHLPRPQRHAQTWATLLRTCRRCDVLLVNGLEMPAIFANRFLRLPMVMKVVGDYAWEYARNNGLTSLSFEEFQSQALPLRLSVLRAGRAWYTRQAHVVITPSQFLKRAVCGWGVPGERVLVVYNGVPEMAYRTPPREEARAKLGMEGLWLTTIGRLVPWKGVDALIRTLSKLPEGVKLAVVGDGPERASLEGMAHAMNLAERLRFTGAVSQETAKLYLKAADCFVLNTEYEGCSHVLLEALAMGTPIVTTDIPANREIITHSLNGLLIPLRNQERLAEAITALITQPSLAERLSREGQRRAQDFRWDTMLKETIAILEKATSSTTGNPGL